MKTILTRMKTLVQHNNSPSGTLSYVKHVEVCHPEIALLSVSRSMFPSVFLIPVGTSETWEASQRKIQEHQVQAYLMMEYNQRELSIIGDSTRAQGTGILDFVNNFMSVFRDHRLAKDGVNYLDKPIEITGVDYAREDLSEDAFLIVASIAMTCTRLFIQTTLPGDV